MHVLWDFHVLYMNFEIYLIICQLLPYLQPQEIKHKITLPQHSNKLCFIFEAIQTNCEETTLEAFTSFF